MNLKLLDINKFIKGLVPVTSTELKTRSREYSPDGLFSEKIFGVEGSMDRSRKFSYINLNTFVIHPSAYRLLIRIDRRLEKFFSTEQAYSIDSKGNLVADDKNGVSGLQTFIRIFSTIKLKGETEQRDKIVKLLTGNNRLDTLFIDKIPIIPPELRPMYEDEKGEMMLDELNNYYISIMRKASQIKSLGNRSGSLFDLLNFHLQQAVNEHDKFLKTKIAKKSGLIRANMLGKRVDFSARGVITPGPDLRVSEIGVPLRMAVALFEPFLINYFLFSNKYPHKKELEAEVKAFAETDLSVDSLKRVLKSTKTGDDIPNTLRTLLFDACEVVMKGRVVLAKRDPVLHDGGYAAFYPKLVNGNTIRICTLQIGGFNADFDGDQMALFHPLSNEAQDEAKKRMMNGVGSKHTTQITYAIDKEMCAGLYGMTKDIKNNNSPVAVNDEILMNAVDPYIQVVFRGHKTTMGRAIFNRAFPPDFKFIDMVVTKKVVNGLIPEVISKYGEDQAKITFSMLERIAFKFATLIAPSLSLDMAIMPDSVARLTQKLSTSTTEEADKILKEAEIIMIKQLQGTGLGDFANSGAGKGWDQPRQMFVAKGIIADPKGNILPAIQGSFAGGLNNADYFAAAAGSRKGLADRTLNTAETGYFTRQLVYVLATAEASPIVKDCKTKRLIDLTLTEDVLKRVKERFVNKNNKIIKFDPSLFKIGDTISLRSPIFCESKKFCHTCYGGLLQRHKTPYVGILAGASIGERGTQLIMRTFHSGGAAKIAKHNVLQELLDNDPLIHIDLKKYFIQEDDKLITLKPCKVTLDLDNYENNDTVEIKEGSIWVYHLLAKVEFDDAMFHLILDYPVELQDVKSERVGKNLVICEYAENDIVIEVPLEVVEIKEQVNYVKRLLGGKVVYRDPGHLLTKLLRIYGGSISDLDLVHFEVLISQILRDRKNPALAARLGKTWDPIMMNVKNTVFAQGFVQGLAFENVNKAIETGLTSGEDIDLSLFGRIITGEVVE